ncbi:MAG TPA: hypothetical protein VGN60_07445 [Devosia sp.]|jgi:hypothetical protein|nr:hypothetical protein [Devosia sp.]
MDDYRLLGTLRDKGYQLTAYCNAEDCRHSAGVDLDLMVDRLGRDFVAIGDPQPLAPRLRCAVCGGKDLTIHVTPPTDPAPV